MSDPAVWFSLLFHLGARRMGRRRLAEAAGMTEMVVRQAIDELRLSGLVRAERTGLFLTDAARTRYGALLASVRAITPLSLDLLGSTTGFLAGHLAFTPAEPAWALRDVALARGASGLILLIYAEGAWCFAHNREPFGEKNPHDAAVLRQQIAGPEENDALAAVCAPSMHEAHRALWALMAESTGFSCG